MMVKRFLFMLLCLCLWQIPVDAGTCCGPEQSDMEITANNFKKLADEFKDLSEKKDGIYYVNWEKTENELFDTLLNLIEPADKRNSRLSYDTDLLKIEYTENEKHAGNGFARLVLTFPKQTPAQYTFIFRLK